MSADLSMMRIAVRGALLARPAQSDLAARLRPRAAAALTGLILTAVAFAVRSAAQRIAPGVAPFVLIFPAAFAAIPTSAGRRAPLS